MENNKYSAPECDGYAFDVLSEFVMLVQSRMNGAALEYEADGHLECAEGLSWGIYILETAFNSVAEEHERNRELIGPDGEYRE